MILENIMDFDALAKTNHLQLQDNFYSVMLDVMNEESQAWLFDFFKNKNMENETKYFSFVEVLINSGFLLNDNFINFILGLLYTATRIYNDNLYLCEKILDCIVLFIDVLQLDQNKDIFFVMEEFQILYHILITLEEYNNPQTVNIDFILQKAILSVLDCEDQVKLLQEILKSPENSQFILVLHNEENPNEVAELRQFFDPFSFQIFSLIFGHYEDAMAVMQNMEVDQ